MLGVSDCSSFLNYYVTVCQDVLCGNLSHLRPSLGKFGLHSWRKTCSLLVYFLCVPAHSTVCILFCLVLLWVTIHLNHILFFVIVGDWLLPGTHHLFLTNFWCRWRFKPLKLLILWERWYFMVLLRWLVAHHMFLICFV